MAHVWADLLEDIQSRAQHVQSRARLITVTRATALYSLAFASTWRGYDSSPHKRISGPAPPGVYRIDVAKV